MLQETLKPRANGHKIVGQQLPTLLYVTCCVHLHTLVQLHVVDCCWEFLRKVWNRSNFWANDSRHFKQYQLTQWSTRTKVWPVPYTCAQPYHPDGGSHRQLFRPCWSQGRNSCSWLPIPEWYWLCACLRYWPYHSLRASSLISASEASLATPRFPLPRALSRETRFTLPNRRACSQPSHTAELVRVASVQLIGIVPRFPLFRDRWSVGQQCWIRLHSSSNIVGTTHALYTWSPWRQQRNNFARSANNDRMEFLHPFADHCQHATTPNIVGPTMLRVA